MRRRARNVPERPQPMRNRGLDPTLIRWTLRLTPTQRLAVLQDHVNLVASTRRASTTD